MWIFKHKYMCNRMNIFNTTLIMNSIASSSDNRSLFTVWGDEIPDESLSYITTSFQNINMEETELPTRRSIFQHGEGFVSIPQITDYRSIYQTTEPIGAECLEIVDKHTFNRYLMTGDDTDSNNIPNISLSSRIFSDSQHNHTPYHHMNSNFAISQDTITTNISTETSDTVVGSLNKGGARPKSRKSIPVSQSAEYLVTNLPEGDRLKDHKVLKKKHGVKKTNELQRTQGCVNTNSSVLQLHVEKNKSELEYEVDQVNHKLENMYNDLKDLYQFFLNMSQTIDKIVKNMDKILENILLKAIKIKKRFPHDDIARSETLNPLIYELDTNHAAINELLKSTQIKKENLSEINEDIRSVELRGGKIIKKRKIILLILALLNKFQKIYKEQTEKINEVRLRF